MENLLAKKEKSEREGHLTVRPQARTASDQRTNQNRELVLRNTPSPRTNALRGLLFERTRADDARRRFKDERLASLSGEEIIRGAVGEESGINDILRGASGFDEYNEEVPPCLQRRGNLLGQEH